MSSLSRLLTRRAKDCGVTRRSFHVLIPIEMYFALADMAYPSKRAIGDLVREGIVRVLKNPSCKCKVKK